MNQKEKDEFSEYVKRSKINPPEKTDFLKAVSLSSLDASVVLNNTYSENDPEWKSKFYKEILKNAKESEDYMRIAASIADQLDDKKWAKEVYQIAIDQVDAEDGLAYLKMVISIINHLQDREWGIQVLKNEVNDETSSSNCCYMATEILEETNDKKLCREIFQQAEKNAKANYEYDEIAREVAEHLKDKDWAREIYEQSLCHLDKPFTRFSFVSNSTYYCNIAEAIIRDVDDYDLAKEAYRKAIAAMNQPDDMVGDKSDDYPTIDKSIKSQILGRTYKTYKLFHEYSSDKEIAIHKRISGSLMIVFVALLVVTISILPFLGVYWIINYFCGRSVGWIEAICFSVIYLIISGFNSCYKPWSKLHSLRKELKNRYKEMEKQE